MDWPYFAKFAGGMLLFIAALYACNESHERRWRQRWLPVLAVCLGAVVLFLEWRYKLAPIIEGVIIFLDGVESFVAWLDNATQGNFSGILSRIDFFNARKWVRDNPVLVCNALILAAMIPAKLFGLLRGKVARGWRAILRVVSFKRWGKEPQPAGAQLAPAYQYRASRGSENAAGNVFLLPAWVYPQRYLFLLALLLVLALLCGLAGLAWDVQHAAQHAAQHGSTAHAYQPVMEQFRRFHFPAIPLLIILESFWYLGGKRPEAENVQQPAAAAAQAVKYDLGRL